MRSSAPPLQFTSLMRNPPTDILLRGNYANSIPVILNSSLSSNTVLSRSCPPTQSRPPTPHSVTLLHLIAEPFPSPSSHPRRHPPPASPLRGKDPKNDPTSSFRPCLQSPHPSVPLQSHRDVLPPRSMEISLLPPLSMETPPQSCTRSSPSPRVPPTHHVPGLRLGHCGLTRSNCGCNCCN